MKRCLSVALFGLLACKGLDSGKRGLPSIEPGSGQGSDAAAGGRTTPDAAESPAPENDGSAPPDGAGTAGTFDPTTDLVDGPGRHALNLATGALNVDYARYLARHEIAYHRPNPNPLFGLPVGTGRMGAMVWSANGLTMQVSGVDVSPQGAFAAGLVNLATTPPLDSGSGRFEQVLSLHDGTLTTSYGGDRTVTVTVMGAPSAELMGIHVEDRRPGVSAVALEVSLWDVSTLGNSGDVPDIGTWRTVTSYADGGSAGISRGQTDRNNFGYTLAAAVEGTAFTSQSLGPNRVLLQITPAPSYTIWFTAATRLNAPNHDSIAQAKALLGQTRSRGYPATLAAFQKGWHDFWSRSFVQYANGSGDADYLETFYYLATYVIAAGATGNYPFHFINGVFRATRDTSKWSNAYWYWNQRDVYSSFLASNHVDLFAIFNQGTSRNFEALRAFTQTRYQIDGIWVPETMGWDGNARGTVNSDYTKNTFSTGAEAALNMYLQYAYTGDLTYLRTVAYPFMREAANFYLGILSRDPATGRTFMALSNAHETYWNVRNAITDLVAVRRLFPLVIATSTALGLDEPSRARWLEVLDTLVPYPMNESEYLPHEPPLSRTRNGENVACELIWPYDATGLGAPDYQRAVTTWNRRPFPYGNVWANDAIQAARLGLGEATFQGMKTMLGRYQSYPNGFTSNTNGVFEYWGVHLTAMNESLLHSYNDKIRVFPAIPSDPTFVGRFTLLAKGGFLVSSEREAGEVKYVALKSLRGSPATVVNPWGTEPAQVRSVPDGAVVLTAARAELTFATVAGRLYIVERTARPLDRFAYASITATANRNVKRLSNPPCSLGL